MTLFLTGLPFLVIVSYLFTSLLLLFILYKHNQRSGLFLATYCISFIARHGERRKGDALHNRRKVGFYEYE